MLSLRSTLPACLATLLIFTGSPLLAAPGQKPAARKQQLTGPKKRPGSSASVARLQPVAVAPTTNVLHDHQPVTLSGWVTGADGMPLPGATVWLTNTHGQAVVTNRQGDFILNLAGNAPVSLTIGCAGYQNQVVLLMRPSQQNGVNVALQRVPGRP